MNSCGTHTARLSSGNGEERSNEANEFELHDELIDWLGGLWDGLSLDEEGRGVDLLNGCIFPRILHLRRDPRLN
jgi:hypothetical protein